MREVFNLNILTLFIGTENAEIPYYFCNHLSQNFKHIMSHKVLLIMIMSSLIVIQLKGLTKQLSTNYGYGFKHRLPFVLIIYRLRSGQFKEIPNSLIGEFIDLLINYSGIL